MEEESIFVQTFLECYVIELVDGRLTVLYEKTEVVIVVQTYFASLILQLFLNEDHFQRHPNKPLVSVFKTLKIGAWHV